MPKVGSIHKKVPAAERAHEVYTDCIIAAEQKCMGQVLCTGCGTKVKVMKGPGNQLSAKSPSRALSPTESSRQRSMCQGGSLSKREKKELLRIARAVGIVGVSQRNTKADLCGKIRTALR
jgi:hypothetical protein